MVSCTFVLDNNAKKVRLVCAGTKVLIIIRQVELKKSYKADLEHQRVSGFLLGLIVVLSMFLVCLEFTTSSQSTDVADDILYDISQDIEMMPVLQQKNMIAAPQAAPKRAVPEKMKVVDEQVADVVESKEAGESNSENQTGTYGSGVETDSKTETVSPVAVDKDDNPLNFQVVERLPEFPGGMVEFMKWLTKNLSYPVIAQQQKIQGKVLVSFIINKDGTVSSPKVVKSVSPELDREALRVIRIMPKWKPGEDRGKPCRTYFCIPVVFKL